MNAKARNLLSFLCNLAVFVCTVISVASFLTEGGEGNMREQGARMFMFFTVDSNILAAVSCAVMMFFNVRHMRCPDAELPGWAVLVKYIGTSAVALTFAVVVLFLGPLIGYFAMIEGCNFFMHVSSPLLAAVSLILLERRRELSVRDAALSVIPAVIYACVYFRMVMILGPDRGGWTDFYCFNMGGLWPVSVIAVLGGNFVLALLLRRLHNRVLRKTETGKEEQP